MKTIELRKKNPADLKKLLAELEAELREFRFGMTGGRTKNVKQGRALRKDMARVMSVLNEQ